MRTGAYVHTITDATEIVRHPFVTRSKFRWTINMQLELCPKKFLNYFYLFVTREEVRLFIAPSRCFCVLGLVLLTKCLQWVLWITYCSYNYNRLFQWTNFNKVGRFQNSVCVETYCRSLSLKFIDTNLLQL